MKMFIGQIEWKDGYKLVVGNYYFKVFDSNGNEIYYENSNNRWYKQEYDSNGNVIYYEDSNKYWIKQEYDSNGNEIYYESSKGKIIDNRPKPTKEMTVQEICDELGYNVKVVK